MNPESGTRFSTKFKFPAILMLTGLLSTAIVFYSPEMETEISSDGLKIACSQDAAGLLITQAAGRLNRQVKITDTGGVSFLQLADCCGSQAEFALAAGKFDMAVLCPDAAALFLKSGKPFIIAGGIVKNSNVLVASVDHPNGPFKTVAYSNGRDLQKKILVENLGPDLELWPVLPPALPYALERQAVDAVVLDAINAVKADVENQCRPLVFDGPTSVLVVRQDLMETPVYRDFITVYNFMVDHLNGDGLTEALATFITQDKIEEKVKLWRLMKVQYLKIQL